VSSRLVAIHPEYYRGVMNIRPTVHTNMYNQGLLQDIHQVQFLFISLPCPKVLMLHNKTRVGFKLTHLWFLFIKKDERRSETYLYGESTESQNVRY
jgi:hypothetical protein